MGRRRGGDAQERLIPGRASNRDSRGTGRDGGDRKSHGGRAWSIPRRLTRCAAPAEVNSPEATWVETKMLLCHLDRQRKRGGWREGGRGRGIK